MKGDRGEDRQSHALEFFPLLVCSHFREKGGGGDEGRKANK